MTKQLLAKGRVSRPYFGLHMAELTPALADELGLASTVKGVVVDRVYADSPAAASGLAVGDVITKLDDKDITNAKELGAMARAQDWRYNHLPGFAPGQADAGQTEHRRTR